MLFGGSRSGKTFLLIRNIVMRALKAKTAGTSSSASGSIR
jgi:hypothetical protein